MVTANKPVDFIWQSIREEIIEEAQREPVLASFYHATILNHDSLAGALSFHLAAKLDSQTLPALLLREVFEEALAADASIMAAVRADIQAYKERDPACDQFSMPLLFFKGFHAIQSYRVAHWLWAQKRYTFALYLQNKIAEVFAVDIHPAARVGCGIMIDHATGVVVGETTVIENNVSMLHAVTLGGTGSEAGDRHPKIRRGVLISAGAKILGNIEVGEGAKVGAGSVVMTSVPPHTTVAGVPAKVVGRAEEAEPSRDMNHALPSDE